MAPVPWGTNGRLDIEYTVGGIVHKTRFPVVIQETMGVWSCFNRATGLYDATAEVVAQIIWARAKKFFSTSVLEPNYVLYTYAYPAFIPVDGAPVGTGGGSNSTAYFPCTDFTMTFKDADNHLFKSVWSECSYPAPTKSTVQATPSDVTDYIKSMIRDATGDLIGNFVNARSGSLLTRTLFWTVSLNRHTRRRRSLA